jgi:N-dimethylarginine dimethylaminohydrolase
MRSRAQGLIDDVVTLPPGVTLEGAGDCLWDAHRRLFWMGCGFRSGVEAREIVSAQFGVPCVALALKSSGPKYTNGLAD